MEWMTQLRPFITPKYILALTKTSEEKNYVCGHLKTFFIYLGLATGYNAILLHHLINYLRADVCVFEGHSCNMDIS
jgi:hypothetical protein